MFEHWRLVRRTRGACIEDGNGFFVALVAERWVEEVAELLQRAQQPKLPDGFDYAD